MASFDAIYWGLYTLDEEEGQGGRALGGKKA